MYNSICMKMQPSHLLCFLCCLICVVVNQGFDGCTVRYGSRSCQHRMLYGVIVTCDGLGSEVAVPQNLPDETVYLSLVNFQLPHLTRADFEKFTKVECLSLVNSGLETIEQDTFSAMEALMELSLQKTLLRHKELAFVNDEHFTAILLSILDSPHIHSIHIRPTENLSHLKTLNLRGNGIREVQRDLFPALTNVERLDLSDNQLEYLDWDWIKDMPKLNQLFLNNNRLQTIPQLMYGRFFAVKTLRLAGNRFHCNCKLRWLQDFFSKAVDRDLDKDQVECLSPQHIHMSGAEFLCSRPSKPLVTYEQITDNSYAVNCSSEGDPAPSLTLTLPSGRPVITPPPPDLSKNKPVTPQILSEPGVVYCEASNSEGRSETSEGLPQTMQQTSSSVVLQGSLALISLLGLLLAGCR